MIKRHGGSSGIRNVGMLESAAHRPFATFSGRDLYPGIYLKVAAFLQSIVKNHPFIDGNKRTAYSAVFILLKKNGVDLVVKKREAVEFMISVANQNLSVDEISGWLKKHSKKI